MIDEHISDILAQDLINLVFISKTSGVAFILKKPTTEGKHIRLPISYKIYRKDTGIGVMQIESTNVVGGVNDSAIECLTSNPPYDLLPNSNETGIIYFEDLGGKTIDSNPRYVTFRGFLRLVCWVNLKKIGLDKELKTIHGAIWSNLRKEFVQDGYLAGGKIKVSQMVPKRPDPYSIFDLNEAQKQFLTYPYGYFTLNLEYVVFVKPACFSEVTLSPSVC